MKPEKKEIYCALRAAEGIVEQNVRNSTSCAPLAKGD